MSKTLLILNDTAGGQGVRLFLLGDATSCAKSGQKVPQGFYNVELMLNRVTRTEALVGVCGTCLDDKVLVF